MQHEHADALDDGDRPSASDVAAVQSQLGRVTATSEGLAEGAADITTRR